MRIKSIIGTFILFCYLIIYKILRVVASYIPKQRKLEIINPMAQLLNIRASSMSCIIRCHSNSAHIFLPLRDNFTPEARVHSQNHLTLLFIAPEIKLFFFFITKKRKKKNLVTFLSQKRISVFLSRDIPKDFKSQRFWYKSSNA